MLKFSVRGSMTKFRSFYLWREKINHTAGEERVNSLSFKDDPVHICLKSYHPPFFRNLLSIIFFPIICNNLFLCPKDGENANNIGWWAIMENKLFKLPLPLFFHNRKDQGNDRKMRKHLLLKQICHISWLNIYPSSSWYLLTIGFLVNS